MSIDLINIWLILVFLTLFGAGGLLIILGYKVPESNSDSDLMPCGHPQSEAVHSDGGTAYCRECVRLATEARWHD